MDMITYATTFENLPAYELSAVDVSALAAQKAELERKQQKAIAIAALTVKYKIDGIEYTFDADDISRARMKDAVDASTFTGQKSTPWKTADNKTVEVNAEQLQAIRALGIQALGALIISQ